MREYLAVVALAATACSTSPEYVSVRGGTPIQTQTSNDDEVEFRRGIPNGWNAELEAGQQLKWGKVGAKLIRREADIHGANGPDCTHDSDCSADDLADNTLTVTGILATVRPEYRLTDWATLWGSAALGPGYFTGLSDENFGVVVDSKLGTSFGLPADGWTFDLGYGTTFSPDTPNLDANTWQYWEHGPFIGLTWKGDLL